MRYYTEVSKELFLENVKSIMQDDGFPFDVSKFIDKDLSKVNFNWENYTTFDSKEGFCNYPVGYKELKEGFHVFFAAAGGDWEIPVCYIFYQGDGEIRAYIPKEGNLWNKEKKTAYGSEEEDPTDDDEVQDKIINTEYSEEAMIKDILKRIIKK